MALQILNQEDLTTNFTTYLTDFETIKQNIYDFNQKSFHKISFKYNHTPDDKRLIIYNDFVKNPTKDKLFNNSRSIVLSLDEVPNAYKLVAYTHPVVDYNNYGKMNGFADKKFTECYEGTLMSVYYCNGKWNYSTRRCLDASQSFWTYNNKISDVSHYDMFLDSLVTSVADFEASLDVSKSYYFVVVHHKNKTYVDYTERFGASYKKIFLLFVRDSRMKETSTYNDVLRVYEDTSVPLTNEQVKERVESDKNVMGYSLNDDGQFYVYHTKYYEQFEKAAPYAHSYEIMLVELYKRDNLDEHFKLFPENIKYKQTNFDSKGVMYGVFTYSAMTLLNLYYYFTSYDGVALSHKNAEDFKKLFTDKNFTLQSLLYKMKGTVLSQKRKLEINDVKKLLKYYINSQDLVRCLKEMEEVKKTEGVLFKKINPKYNSNAIVNEFLKNL
jgi:hypothetical protein